MKQVLQNLGTGETSLVDIPVPKTGRGQLLIQSQASLVSLGTEKMLVDFGKANLLSKARQQPEKVKQVIQKIKIDGLATTVQAVRSKLDQPLPLGYCNAGVVVEVGEGVDDFQIGDRVLSNGPHAEFVCVPQHLCAKIPDDVPFEDACFGVVASIGLQGIRLLQPTLGETFVVTGLGLIGLLCVQMLRSNGCKVLGIDFDSKKCALAREFGAETVDLSIGEEAVVAADLFTAGRGVDGVLITASTKSSDPVSQAAQMCRKRGRIVLVGVTGLELNRGDFYEKELSFQVSCSYGPGRYDDAYEQRGQDYPIGFVRWTEQRNFEAVLGLIESGGLTPQPLVSHHYELKDAVKAYDVVASGKALGIVLEYDKAEPQAEQAFERCVAIADKKNAVLPNASVGMLGAGNFTGQVLLPALAQTGARLHSIASGSGVTGTHHGKKFGFEQSISNADLLFESEQINIVFITTRHNSHAHYAEKALQTGKAVFVEKPLALSVEQLQKIHQAYQQAKIPFLMVGFNRRFSPHTERMKELLATLNAPRAITITANVGEIPAQHWTQDPQVGGGRIVGEACHFIDLARFLAGSPITHSSIDHLQTGGDDLGDNAMIHLRFSNGSIATINYLANGDKSFPKERVEVFCAGKILQCDNFRVLRGYGFKDFKKFKTRSLDKGHNAEMYAVVEALKNGQSAPIPVDEIFEVSKVAIEMGKQ